MRITLLLAAAAIFGVVHDVGERGSPAPGSSTLPRSPATMQLRSLEPPATEVCLGDLAPDFAYQGPDARWRRLRGLVAEAPVLLIFGANDGVLRIVEGEREALMDLGVIPVAIVGSRLGTARGIVNRLELRFAVLADPRGVIAAQFNALDPASGRQLPSWFMIDAKRRVRGLGRQALPLRGYAELAANAMGLPSNTATRPAAK